MSLPVSVIIPTRNRTSVLLKTLDTFYKQTMKVSEIIIVDGSENDETRIALAQHELSSVIKYSKANQLGAAIQRNQGVARAFNPYVLFSDDDVYLNPDVVEKLWIGLNRESVGGVSSMIVNQKYTAPGKITRFMYRLLDGVNRDSYAGRLIGPGWNLLPEDNDVLPEYVDCEWLNTTCTLYRKESFPSPIFSHHFFGYSLMEDVTLSAIVNRKWKLLNARTARVYHDSQPGEHKKNTFVLSRMELNNRHFLMKKVLHRKSLTDYGRLFIFEAFGIIASMTTLASWKNLPATVGGKCAAIYDIMIKR